MKNILNKIAFGFVITTFSASLAYSYSGDSETYDYSHEEIKEESQNYIDNLSHEFNITFDDSQKEKILEATITLKKGEYEANSEAEMERIREDYDFMMSNIITEDQKMKISGYYI